MNKILKIILKISLLAVCTLIAGVSFIFWIAKSNTDDVKAMCALKVGTQVELVLSQARSLKFSKETSLALGKGFQVFSEGHEVTWDNDKLPEIKNGKVILGKTSIPPFGRNYCEILFRDGKVTSNRTWSLD